MVVVTQGWYARMVVINCFSLVSIYDFSVSSEIIAWSRRDSCYAALINNINIVTPSTRSVALRNRAAYFSVKETWNCGVFILSILQMSRSLASLILTSTFLHFGLCASSRLHTYLSCLTFPPTFSSTVQFPTSSRRLSIKPVSFSAKILQISSILSLLNTKRFQQVLLRKPRKHRWNLLTLSRINRWIQIVKVTKKANRRNRKI